MRLIRCNRCGTEAETPMPKQNLLFGLMAPAKIPSWSRVRVEETPAEEGVMGRGETADLCEDCREVFVEQFMKGAAIAAITQPLAQTTFPHQPMTDCQLVWNPGKGGFLCYHDDPELYHALILDNAQNVAEGVPEKRVIPCGHMEPGTSCDWNVCNQPEPVKIAQEQIRAMDAGLQAKIGQLADDVITAGVAHSFVQRCTEACSEAHTYVTGCILDSVVHVKGEPVTDEMYPANSTPEQWKKKGDSE